MFCYEFTIKHKKKPKRNRTSKSFDFALDKRNQSNQSAGIKRAMLNKMTVNPKWKDWKYRLWVELNRKPNLTTEDAIKISGVSQKRVEKYFDKLEADGRIQQQGDSERGISYKVMEV